MIGLLLLSELDDVVVTDTYRTFSSIRYGGYGYGISGGASKGESVTIGKITFMSKGNPVISLNGVTDPNGLKRLTLSVKKALYPKKELQHWLSRLQCFCIKWL